MNRISSKKLLNSKWTSVSPTHKEKHFLITSVAYDEDGIVTECVIEAAMTNREFGIDWNTLKDTSQWLQGWK